MIISSDEGLKLIREYGIPDFPESDCEFYKVNGGVAAVRDCYLGGKELHIAFKKNSRVNAAKVMIEFCDNLNSEIWALIKDEYSHCINFAFACGFKYVELKQATLEGGKMIDVHAMKRKLT